MAQRHPEVERLVGTPGVVELAEGIDLGRQLEDVADLDAVQVLVLEGAEEALDDAVGLRGVVSGADVAEFGSGVEEAEPLGALVGGPLSLTTVRHWSSPVCGSRQSSRRGRPSTLSASLSARRRLSIASRAAVVGTTVAARQNLVA